MCLLLQNCIPIKTDLFIAIFEVLALIIKAYLPYLLLCEIWLMRKCGLTTDHRFLHCSGAECLCRCRGSGRGGAVCHSDCGGLWRGEQRSCKVSMFHSPHSQGSPRSISLHTLSYSLLSSLPLSPIKRALPVIQCLLPLRYGEQLKEARNIGIKKSMFSAGAIGALYLIVYNTFGLGFW